MIGIIIALIVIIALLTIRYIRIRVKTVSRERFEVEAARQAATMEYKDPVITCDFCGAKIDTAKYHTCPNCGADYGQDEEWLERHAPDMESVDRKADGVAAKAMLEAKEKSANTGKYIKLSIIALSVVTIILIAVKLFAALVIPEHEFITRDAELNEYEEDDYKPVDYKINGDGVIYDADGVKITVTGIYVNHPYFEDNNWFKIRCRLENHSGGTIYAVVPLLGVNGKAVDVGYGFHYGWYKNRADVTFYENAYDLAEPEVHELLFANIRIKRDDWDREKVVKKVVLSTTASTSYSAKRPEAPVIFENDDITIMSMRNERGNYSVWIDNSSDVDYVVAASPLRINGSDVSSYTIFEQIIPAQYVFSTEMCQFHEDGKEYITGPAEAYFAFSCDEAPSKAFTTDYLPLE